MPDFDGIHHAFGDLGLRHQVVLCDASVPFG